LNEPHSVCLLLSDTEHAKALAECERLWIQSKFKEPFQLDIDAMKKHAGAKIPVSPLFSSGKCSSPPTSQAFVDDRQWFEEFLKVASHLDLNDDRFFLRAQLGYQRFMYLMAKYPRGLEGLNFAPSPPIDLLWHTHILQPAVYRRDMLRVVRHVPEHKLLASFDRSIQTYEARTSSEEELWQKEFNESMAVYASKL
jgi:hypothetical protein